MSGASDASARDCGMFVEEPGDVVVKDDPEPNRLEQIGRVAGAVGAVFVKAGARFLYMVELGQPGIQWLALVGSLALIVFQFIMLLHFLSAPWQQYLRFCSVMAAVATLFFEMSPSVIEKIGCVDWIHFKVLESAQFLSMCLGRAFVYMFQATLLGQMDRQAFGTIMAFFHLLLGLLHILMHFDMVPQALAKQAVAKMNKWSSDAPEAQADAQAEALAARASQAGKQGKKGRIEEGQGAFVEMTL